MSNGYYGKEFSEALERIYNAYGNRLDLYFDDRQNKRPFGTSAKKSEKAIDAAFAGMATDEAYQKEAIELADPDYAMTTSGGGDPMKQGEAKERPIKSIGKRGGIKYMTRKEEGAWRKKIKTVIRNK